MAYESKIELTVSEVESNLRTFCLNTGVDEPEILFDKSQIEHDSLSGRIVTPIIGESAEKAERTKRIKEEMKLAIQQVKLKQSRKAIKTKLLFRYVL